MSNFTVLANKAGYVKLSDGTIIRVRVVITDIIEGELKPVGPDLQVGFQISFSVKAPDELKQSVKNKPLPPPDGSHIKNLKIWDIIKIIEKENAVDECLYKARDTRTYKISVETEVTIVARTLEYRDRSGNPIYHFRWSPCIKIRLAEM